MDRSSRQKVNEETVYLNETLDKMDRIDLYRIFIQMKQILQILLKLHETFSEQFYAGTQNKSQLILKTGIISSMLQS